MCDSRIEMSYYYKIVEIEIKSNWNFMITRAKSKKLQQERILTEQMNGN